MTTKRITPEKLAAMLNAVIEAGSATGLIKPAYLKMMTAIIPQIQKNHIRQQVKLAKGEGKPVIK